VTSLPATLSFTADRGKAKYTVRSFDSQGALSCKTEGTLATASNQRKVASLLGIEVELLMRYAKQFIALADQNTERPLTEQYAVEAAPPAPRTMFRLRGEVSSLTTAFPDFHAALAAALETSDTVIEWDDLDAAAAVDVDYSVRPDAAMLQRAAECVSPRPSYVWVTKSGGLRLVYLATDSTGAECLAGLGVLSIGGLLDPPASKIELKTRTRRPPGEYARCEQTADLNGIAALYSGESVGADAIAQWLEEHQYVPGNRYPHTRCPVNPYPAGEGNSPPVVCGDNHLKCYICERDGTRRGSRDPGYFPIAALACGGGGLHLRRCVANFTHWAHARYVIAALRPELSEPVARAVYRAALVARHGVDARTPGVFSTLANVNGIMRMAGYWATANAEPLVLDKNSAVLARLPSCQYLDEEAGTLATDRGRVELLSQNIDLTENGYPPVTTIWGTRVTRFLTLSDKRVYVTLSTETLRNEEMQWRRPRYIPLSKRGAVEEAWRTLERIYPGVDRNAVTLLIAAKGCIESAIGLPPMVFFSGPSGAGKSSTIALAAGICGDRVTRVIYNPNTDRFFSGIRSARSKGSFANFDEFIKHARSAGKTPDQAMEVLLALDPATETHLLYVGPVPLGDLPVFTWTDTAVPPEIQRHQQIGRRMHHVPLLRRVYWDRSLRDHGITDPGSIRSQGGAGLLDAANVILSDVMDDHFRETRDFASIAADLGVRPLQDSDLAREKEEMIRQLFSAVCSGKDAASNRWPGRGWIFFRLNEDSPVAAIWRALADDRDPLQCRAVDETDLATVLGLSTACKVERRKHGFDMVVRFVSHEGDRVNGELRDTVELGPVVSRVHGSGDAIGEQPVEGRDCSIPAAFIHAFALGGVQDR
jgi:hypothetical protein